MRYCIFLTFDKKAEKHIQALRRAIADEVIGAPEAAGKMGPHLTLLVFDYPDLDEVLQRFDGLAAKMSPFMLRLNTIGVFRGHKRNVIYIAPIASKKLRQSYLLCLGDFLDSAVEVYKKPANWKPHVTLVKGIRGHVFAKAKMWAEKNWKPTAAWTSTIGLINVQKPLEILASKKLRM